MDQLLDRHDGQARTMSFALLALSLVAPACGATKAVGSGGSTATAGVTSSSVQASGATTSATNAASSSSTGAPFVCNPPAQPGSLYANSANEFGTLAPISMCQYRGDVLLIVDTAAE